MTIADQIAARSITSILHFTTNRGSLGILDSRALKARARLDTDARLEKIFQPNAASRPRDAAWLDYVNLSISRINESFFGTSAGSWHKEKDLWWCILDFKPEILSHAGVYFTTTNNMYSGVQRGLGESALEAAYAPSITQWRGKVIDRPKSHSLSLTTCPQAEVLYPAAVSTEFLQAIYVSAGEFADELASQIAVVNHPHVQIEVRPDLFGGIR